MYDIYFFFRSLTCTMMTTKRFRSATSTGLSCTDPPIEQCSSLLIGSAKTLHGSTCGVLTTHNFLNFSQSFSRLHYIHWTLNCRKKWNTCTCTCKFNVGLIVFMKFFFFEQICSWGPGCYFVRHRVWVWRRRLAANSSCVGCNRWIFRRYAASYGGR